MLWCNAIFCIFGIFYANMWPKCMNTNGLWSWMGYDAIIDDAWIYGWIMDEWKNVLIMTSMYDMDYEWWWYFENALFLEFSWCKYYNERMHEWMMHKCMDVGQWFLMIGNGNSNANGWFFLYRVYSIL